MSAVRDWLNGLDDTLAKDFFDWTLGNCNRQHVFNCDVPGDLGLYSHLDPTEWSGARWLEHITCDTILSGDMIDCSGTYPRLQLQFNKRDARGKVVTPSRPRGGRPGVSNVRAFFDNRGAEAQWIALKATAEGAAKVKISMVYHNLAFKAANPGVALPSDLGSGSAIAHYCDRHTCCKGAHLVLLTQAENMKMQHCPGAVLVVMGGVIIKTQQCPHYRAEGGNVVQLSCARVSVVDVSSLVQIAPSQKAAFEAAEARFDANVADEFV